MKGPRRVALTGGIATGKSYVRARLAALGVPTIDSDTLARDAVAPGTPGLQAVAAAFGPAVLDPGGGLDRRRLGEIVFADPARRRELEAIIHPIVRRATEEWFASLPPETPFAVADIPLLYETGRDEDFDTTIVVVADPEEQVRRVVARDGLSADEARQRVAAQLPIAEKAARADFVIRTDGSFADTDRQVGEVAAALARLAQS